MALRNASGKEIRLRAVRSNAGLQAAYRRKLMRLVEEMHRSYLYWLVAAWRRNPPALAQDANPAAGLNKELRGLGKQWQKRFDEGAEDLAKFFATKSWRSADVQLKTTLRKAGWTVDLKMTKAMRDVLRASVEENVALIKSIPQTYHTEVVGLVMRSVTAGRDLRYLTNALDKRYDITRKRAELIARDQNNKATAAIARVRYLDLGIQKAIWLHSGGGKTKRPTHVKNSGKPFDVDKGWYDPAVKRRIHPGELINCRCVARPMVKGFS